MLESLPEDLSSWNLKATATALEANERLLIEHGCRKLVLAAHWADLHPGDLVDPSGPPGRETPTRPGGEGTPTVAGFCTGELGALLGVSAGTARNLIADALDLRHRHPRIWVRVCAARVSAASARRVAQFTRHLQMQGAGYVDARVADLLGTVSWGRLEAILTAAIYDADPVGAETAAETASQERFVRVGRSDPHGLRSLYARAAAGDVLCFKAVVDRIGEILTERGDGDTADVVRSKALGVLAQPAYALKLLLDHRDDMVGALRSRPPMIRTPTLRVVWC